MDLPYDQQLLLKKMIDDYKAVDAYRSSKRKLNYMQFDYAVVNDLTLFMIEPDLSFEALEQRVDVILGALPAVKRIFAQPFIHLKQRNVILPVESVRTVNNDTLNHIATHSELWADVKDGEIKPDKLLTRTYEDNYGIYENKVFCNVVDNILAFSRSHMRFLKEMIYTTQTIEFNLLERINHLNYFLALGKIHIGYSQNYAQHYGTAVRCLNKLQFILNTIVPRLKRPVYKKNKRRPANLKIRKTNILSMHKEYHRVYKLALYFSHDDTETVEITNKDIVGLAKNYYFFCQALCIFAIGHFNFVCNVTKAFDMSDLSLDFVFKKWALKLSGTVVDGWQVLSLTVKKNRTYNILLIPSLYNNNDALVQKIKDAQQADEYIVLSPHEETETATVPIAITSIESFRRIQQILLRAMIYADEDRDDCPFCNSKLTVNNELATDEPVYECSACRTQIFKDVCPDTGKPYFYTKIIGQTAREESADEYWLKKRKDEGKMYFRNITETDDNFDPVCPHCGKIHR